MVLAQKQTHRSMEQKSEALNKFTFIWSIMEKKPRTSNGERIVSSIHDARKTGQPCAKE